MQQLKGSNLIPLVIGGGVVILLAVMLLSRRVFMGCLGAVAVVTAIVGYRQSQKEMETLKETTDKQADVQLAMIEFKNNKQNN